MLSRCAVVFLIAMSSAMPAYAQFGIGGRIAMVQGDEDEGTDSERFTGGHIRAMLTPRTGIEVALDVRSETNEAETLRVKQYPLQASLLLFPTKGAFAPYLLGGGGWYTNRIETLDGDETILSETSRDFGWHGGFGLELRFGRHFAAHGDYRYTHLNFGDDDDEEEDSGLFSRFLPSYQGSMWTAGMTVYF